MVNWLSAAKTHKGKIRRVNQDSLIQLDSQGFWAVADGMGGHTAGDYASQLITTHFGQFNLEDKSLDEIACLLDDSLNELNNTLVEYAKAHDASAVGSTVASLTLTNHGVGLAHWVGDSRIYQLREGGLKLLSHDHSLMQELLDFGQISQKDANNFPPKNIITRAVGAGNKVYSECKIIDYAVGDIFLLCSDGLTNEVEQPLLKDCLQGIIDGYEQADTSLQNHLEKNTQALLDLSLQNLAIDNISFILVWIAK